MARRTIGTPADAGENAVDPRWRLFCDFFRAKEGILVPGWGGHVRCQNHVVSLTPLDGGAERSWNVRPLEPELDAFHEYMRECGTLDWDVGLDGVIDDCRVICVNNELVRVTSLDGGLCPHAESWMREELDPMRNAGDFAPFGKPWDTGSPR